MRLSAKSLLALFGVGCICGLVGDHAHVATSTTRYLDVGGVPTIWGSPLFFIVTVGVATALIGEIRVRLGPSRPGTLEEGLAGIASVLAIYLLTALLSDESTSTVTAFIACLAILVAVRFRDGRWSLVLGAAAAVIGPIAEIVQHRAGVFEYASNVDGLADVAPWLVPLYFAFGVVASRLGGILATRPSSAEGE